MISSRLAFDSRGVGWKLAHHAFHNIFRLPESIIYAIDNLLEIKRFILI
ncbi:MAG: hypothetical protein IKG79_07125 [Neisseriaceae bacterium]|nr:hypothetical protein [Neisseriaceae bacterium]